MRMKQQLSISRPKCFPIFSGSVYEGRPILVCQVGKAFRPYNNDYFKVQFWIYPKTIFHLVKVSESHKQARYKVFSRRDINRLGQVVFRNPVGHGIVFIPSTDYITLTLNAPRWTGFLRLRVFDPDTDTQSSFQPRYPKMTRRFNSHSRPPIKKEGVSA